MGRGVETGGTALALSLLLAGISIAAEPVRLDFARGGNAAGRPTYDNARGFGFESSASPEFDQFSIKLPEGNYRVTLRLGVPRRSGPVSIRAEQRRLMLAPSPRPPEDFSFVVNVRRPELPELPEHAAGGTRVVLKPREQGAASWDDRLTLEFPPGVVRSLMVEPVSVPTLYLAGDSTVTDQALAPNGSWGQYLPAFFDSRIAVANHAESGESLKSFVTELRLAKLLSNLREGDWVMIQFGHNDQKPQWPQTFVEAATTYRSWLRTYIAEIRRRGATPLLVTSPERRNFDTDGHIRPTLAEYAEAMRVVAGEEGVALIDLHASSVKIYEALGPAESPRAFAEGGNDRTHHNDYGAMLLARAVVERLRNSNLELIAGLEKHIAADVGRFDPSRPEPVPHP